MSNRTTILDYVVGGNYSTASHRLDQRSWQFIPTTALALVLNMFVIHLSFFSEQKMKHYKYFVANSALMSILYCLSMLFRAATHTSQHSFRMGHGCLHMHCS